VETYIESGLNALGDPTRLAIFHRLAKCPHAVNELAAGLPVSRPAVSQHLRVLKSAHLVQDRREGTRRVYELNPAGIALLRDHFAQLWDHALNAFKHAAENEYKKDKEKKNDARTSTNGRRRNAHPPNKRPH
jgi:DNA-binding transcriptional ArsR family regulator